MRHDGASTRQAAGGCCHNVIVCVRDMQATSKILMLHGASLWIGTQVLLEHGSTMARVCLITR